VLTLADSETIAKNVIRPNDKQVKFSGMNGYTFTFLVPSFLLPDIGGLDSTIASLHESIIYPLLCPNIFAASSSLSGAPKGVILHGPPGCGKKMLAKALANESGVTFLNITASVHKSEWRGEPNMLVPGLFSLAKKCQPSILFFDEMDLFLRERAKDDHEVTELMKTEFMAYVSHF
jgi:ATP-dependent 26S proteasome regulatory subunit